MTATEIPSVTSVGRANSGKIRLLYVCNAAEFSTLLEVAPSVKAKITRAADQRSAVNRAAAA